VLIVVEFHTNPLGVLVEGTGWWSVANIFSLHAVGRSYLPPVHLGGLAIGRNSMTIVLYDYHGDVDL